MICITIIERQDSSLLEISLLKSFHSRLYGIKWEKVYLEGIFLIFILKDFKKFGEDTK